MFNSLTCIGWNPKTVLDVGGYKGTWTREIKTLFPRASVCLIEPNKYPELRSVDATVFHELLSSEPKQVAWYSNLTTGDSMYKETTIHYQSIDPSYRTTTTLDILFPNQQFDLIKIDCQGAELDILRGGTTLVQQTDVVLLECSFACEYNKGAPTFVDYITYMDSIGFGVLDITEFHRANDILIQIDILFLRKTSPLWKTLQLKIQAD
jgi:FkbM family methyltransferase